MLGWHNVWMQRHGREIALRMAAMSRDVIKGGRPMYALAVVVSLAVLREGSEVVLFLYGIASAGGTTAASMLAGGIGGLAAGAAIGIAIYLGLLSLPTRHLFSVTSWMILLLAAGMASQGAAFLVQADLLPALVQTAWDSSWLLSDRGTVGQVLHTLIGYVARPSGIQVVFYFTTFAVIGGLMLTIARSCGLTGSGGVSARSGRCAGDGSYGACPAESLLADRDRR
jgi:high-affinity iron transporter